MQINLGNLYGLYIKWVIEKSAADWKIFPITEFMIVGFTEALKPIEPNCLI